MGAELQRKSYTLDTQNETHTWLQSLLCRYVVNGGGHWRGLMIVKYGWRWDYKASSFDKMNKTILPNQIWIIINKAPGADLMAPVRKEPHSKRFHLKQI